MEKYMTGLLSRIGKLITGTAHDAVDAVENTPDGVGRTARQSVRDIEEQIGKVEQGQVGVQTEYNLLVAKVDTAQRDIDTYQGYAKQAMAQGKEDIARSAIIDRKAAEARKQAAQQQADQLKPELDKLNQALADLYAKRDAMQQNTSTLEARAAVAEARTTAADILGGIGNGESAAKTFDRLNETVSRQEAEANARSQLADRKQAADPSNKYADLQPSGPSIDDELEALRTGK
jgi:phage shock protein A